jgi:hypothetical protein
VPGRISSRRQRRGNSRNGILKGRTEQDFTLSGIFKTKMFVLKKVKQKVFNSRKSFIFV